MAVDDTSITATDPMRPAVFRAIDATATSAGMQRQVTLTCPSRDAVGDNPFAFGEYGGLGGMDRSQAASRGTSR